MSTTGKIFAAWGNPRGVMRDQMNAGDIDGRALTFILIAGILLSIANLPNAMLQGGLTDDAASEPAAALIAARFFQVAIGALALALVGLLVAPLSHLVARAFGGVGSWATTRLALSWSLMTLVPLAMLSGVLLAVGVASDTTWLVEASFLAGLAGQLVLLYVWSGSLAEAEGFSRTWPTMLVMAAIFIALYGILTLRILA